MKYIYSTISYILVSTYLLHISTVVHKIIIPMEKLLDVRTSPESFDANVSPYQLQCYNIYTIFLPHFQVTFGYQIKVVPLVFGLKL